MVTSQGEPCNKIVHIQGEGEKETEVVEKSKSIVTVTVLLFIIKYLVLNIDNHKRFLIEFLSRLKFLVRSQHRMTIQLHLLSNCGKN